MTDAVEAPPRFRRRLTGAFVIVAAAAAGFLAVVTYTLSSQYRTRTFHDRSRDEAHLALALAPEELTDRTFERLQAAYESRTGASTVAESSEGFFSSSPGLDRRDIPIELLRDDLDEDIASASSVIDGVERYVLGAERDGARYWFFFSTDPVTESLDDLRVVLGISWLVTVAGAGLVGRVIARRTLLPVRDASEAARSMAAGLLETRLDERGDDEFGAWSASFNEMATALQATFARLEAAAARERQFTADMAHELRTPLTGMAAAASILEEEVDRVPADLQRASRLLISDVHRLRDLVLELLELARIDAGSEPVRAEPLVVAAAVSAVVDNVLAAHGQTEGVTIRAPDDLVMRGDRTRVRRVLSNLLDNALRHGAPPINVVARAEAQWVLIEIRDRGRGIAEGDPRRLFDRFTKSDRSRAGGGTGLGLAIAAEHVRAMGGLVRAENRDGGGAVFTVWLPAGPRREAVNAEASSPELHRTAE